MTQNIVARDTFFNSRDTSWTDRISACRINDCVRLKLLNFTDVICSDLLVQAYFDVRSFLHLGSVIADQVIHAKFAWCLVGQVQGSAQFFSLLKENHMESSVCQRHSCLDTTRAAADDCDSAFTRFCRNQVIDLSSQCRVHGTADLILVRGYMIYTEVTVQARTDIFRMSALCLIAPFRIRAVRTSHDDEIIYTILKNRLCLFRCLYLIRSVDRDMKFFLKCLIILVSPSGFHIRCAGTVLGTNGKMNGVNAVCFKIFCNFDVIRNLEIIFKSLIIKEMHAHSYRIGFRHFCTDLLYDLYHDTAAVFHGTAILISSLISNRA